MLLVCCCKPYNRSTACVHAARLLCEVRLQIFVLLDAV